MSLSNKFPTYFRRDILVSLENELIKLTFYYSFTLPNLTSTPFSPLSSITVIWLWNRAHPSSSNLDFVLLCRCFVLSADYFLSVFYHLKLYTRILLLSLFAPNIKTNPLTLLLLSPFSMSTSYFCVLRPYLETPNVYSHFILLLEKCEPL